MFRAFIKNETSLKILPVIGGALLFLAAAIFWLAGIGLVTKNPASQAMAVPAELSRTVYELDASLHRLLSSQLFKDDTSFDLERGKVLMLIERVTELSKVPGNTFHSSLDSVATAAREVFRSFSAGNIEQTNTHLVRFKEAASVVQNGFLPAADETDEARSDGFTYLISAGFLFMIMTAHFFRRSLSLEYTKAQLLDRLKNDDEEMKLANERLVVAENQLTASRGRIEYLLKEKSRLEQDVSHHKMELQRQMLARSAAESSYADLRRGA